MLAALLMAFFLGSVGGAFGGVLTQDMLKSFGGRTEQTIADPARSKQVATQVAALGSELKRFEKSFANSSKALSKLFKNHGATAESMQAEFDLLNADWEAAQSRALDHRFSIRENMTRGEWQAVFAEE